MDTQVSLPPDNRIPPSSEVRMTYNTQEAPKIILPREKSQAKPKHKAKKKKKNSRKMHSNLEPMDGCLGARM